MSGQPPPPPPRKPPPLGPPAAGPPPAGSEPPDPPSSSPSPGTIIGIIAAVLFVLIGLPIISCIGCVAYSSYQAKELMAELEQEEAQRQQEEQEQRQIRERALMDSLAERLYPRAKIDIGQHWTEPDNVRRRRWADWKVRKINDNQYEISGVLELGIKDLGNQTYRWACQYSTFDDPHSSGANWTLERITIEGEAVFP